MRMVTGALVVRYFEVFGQTFIEPKRHPLEPGMQQCMCAFVADIDLEIVAPPGKDHSRSAGLDEKRTPIRDFGKILLDIGLIRRPGLEQKQVNRFAHLASAENVRQVLLEIRQLDEKRFLRIEVKV